MKKKEPGIADLKEVPAIIDLLEIQIINDDNNDGRAIVKYFIVSLMPINMNDAKRIQNCSGLTPRNSPVERFRTADMVDGAWFARWYATPYKQLIKFAPSAIERRPLAQIAQ